MPPNDLIGNGWFVFRNRNLPDYIVRVANTFGHFA